MPLESAVKKSLAGDKIAVLAKRLAAGDMSACDTFCKELDCHNPKLIWTPDLNTMPLSGMNWLYEWWLDKKGDDLAPSAKYIQPEELISVLGYLMILEPDANEMDFFIRLYGSKIQSQSGKDMTNQKVSETWTPLRGFFLITYQAICQRKEAMLTYHSPPEDVNVTAWHRLILPFIDDGKVSRILVAIYPTQRQEVTQLY